MNRNPYKYKGPLDPEKDELVCIPRTEEIDRVIHGIISGDYWAVIGPIQSGKTTFLRLLKKKFTEAHYIYFDFEVAPSNEENLYQWMMDRFMAEVPSDQTESLDDSWKDESPAFKFFEFLKSYKPKDNTKKIIFLFDEIGSIPSLKTFLQVWRKLFHESYNKIELKRYTVIIAGSVDLIEQTIGDQSPFNIAETFYIEDLSEQDSAKLIEEPMNTLNIDVEVEAKDYLISQVRGHPQLLQHLCCILVEKADQQKKSIAKNDVDDAIEIVFKSNTALDILKQDISRNKELRHLVKEIIEGKKRKYFPYKEFSFSGVGAIVDDENYCAIRNKIFERFLTFLFYPADDVLIKRKSRDLFFDEEQRESLPYALKQIRVKNYRGIIEAGISNLPVDAQWIFLTGENGFGKTVFLQALVIGLFGNRDENKILTDDDTKVGIELHAKGKDLVNQFGTPGFKQFTHFTAFGPSRLEIQSPETQNRIERKSSPTYSIFNTDGVLLNIEFGLLIWHFKKDPRFEIVKQTLLELLPHIADIRINGNDEVVYIEKESGNGDNYDPLPFNKLASGHKSIIAMVGDIIIRLFKQQPDIKHPKDIGGIVIIDELDLHLHPKWLREYPTLLSKVFPKVQFIVSTNSEIPFLGAPQKSIFLKLSRNKEEGIQIKRLDLDIKNLLPNSILTSPIFDLEGEEITQVNLKKIDDLKTEDDYKEIMESEEIRKRLRAFKRSNMDYPDRLFEH